MNWYRYTRSSSSVPNVSGAAVVAWSCFNGQGHTALSLGQHCPGSARVRSPWRMNTCGTHCMSAARHTYALHYDNVTPSHVEELELWVLGFGGRGQRRDRCGRQVAIGQSLRGPLGCSYDRRKRHNTANGGEHHFRNHPEECHVLARTIQGDEEICRSGMRVCRPTAAHCYIESL